MNLVAALTDLCASPSKVGKTHIIAIDGPAGAGKTTLALQISQALSSRFSVDVVHMDDLYNGWDHALGENLTEQLSKIIEAQRKLQTYALPQFDWNENKYSHTRDLKPSQILILEGVGSAREIVRNSATTTIWIEVDRTIGIKRVIARDGEKIESHMKQWLIDQEIYFTSDKTRESTQFILST
ncbi:MAG: AAA family ATPase [Actinobacteria bacterium]|nr:AAA family ATPase [Actinomycetota bacterium]